MASSLVFTKASGEGSTFTVYGNITAALANSGLYYTRIKVNSADPWEEIHYAGYDGQDAKFMGAMPNTFTIGGFASAATEGALWTIVDGLLDKNKDNTSYTLSGPVTSPAGIIRNIDTEGIGDGSGLRWQWTMVFQCLGV